MKKLLLILLSIGLAGSIIFANDTKRKRAKEETVEGEPGPKRTKSSSLVDLFNAILQNNSDEVQTITGNNEEFVNQLFSVKNELYGIAPIHLSVAKNLLYITSLLIDADTKINIKDIDGSTPLHYAISFNASDELAQLLVDNGANIHSINNKGQTPLHYTISNIKYEDGFDSSHIIKALKFGADINAGDSNNETILHYATYYQGFIKEKIELITQQDGVDIEAKNNDGRTPLHLAVFRNNASSIDLLISVGANVNTQDNDGNTPLHHAVAAGNRPIIRQLLEAGADRYIRNNLGQDVDSLLNDNLRRAFHDVLH